MKVLIATSGGGHFSPALAVIEKFPKDTQILVVGRKYTFEGDTNVSLEYQTAQKLRIPFASITTGRLQRKVTRFTLFSLFKIPFGFFQAFSIVRKFRPDVSVSFGGYVALPVVLASYFLHIPIVIHEQTLGAGLSNKISSFFADIVCVSWKESKKCFPSEKTVLTGNPLRQELLHSASSPDSQVGSFLQNKKLPVLYITGGSSGSHSINSLVLGCLEKLLEKFLIIHQTGDAKRYSDYERLSKEKEKFSKSLQNRYFVSKFLDTGDVEHVLHIVDLVISRSGINTITELLYFQKKAVLIPFPYGQNNEQKQNAEILEELGLAMVLEEKSTTSELLYKAVIDMSSRKIQFQILEDESKIQKEAAEMIADIISSAIKKPYVEKKTK